MIWLCKSSLRTSVDVNTVDLPRPLLFVAGGIIGFIALIDIISMYGAMAVFLVYYVRFLGRHTWSLTLTLAIALPIAFFFFFEGLMRITMPKGLEFTEPFYNILYDIIY